MMSDLSTRYLPLSRTDRRAMLKEIGAADMDVFFADVPDMARLKQPLDLPPHQSELQVERAMAALAGVNAAAGTMPFFCGAGSYRHYVPASVDHIIQRSEFLTSYTPYQPEIAQGTLQTLFEFQTQVAALTAMEVANASMYDGSTSAAEAVLMACRITKRGKSVLSSRLHPHYRASISTLCDFAGLNIIESDDLAAQIDDETACVVVQNPDFFGSVADLTPLAEACHAKGALLVVVVNEIISLGLIRPPGDMGADIVAAEGQSLGNSLSFGGPYVGLLAARQKFVRQMPGRLCGLARDVDGRRGYVLTLAAREQHIRREKATSNICTSAGLCALAFTCHLALLGGKGLRNLALVNHAQAKKLADLVSKVPGAEVITPDFFNEFTLTTKLDGREVIERLLERNVLGGVPVARLLPDDEQYHNHIIIAATEMNDDEDIATFAQKLQEVIS